MIEAEPYEGQIAFQNCTTCGDNPPEKAADYHEQLSVFIYFALQSLHA
jgi:hypothetical protein